MRSTGRALVLGGVLVLMLGLLVGPTAAAVPKCFGEKATIVGTNGDDVLTGTKKADVIVGLRGDDTIRGKKKDDLICGGKGNDVIEGGGGIDLMFGEGGADEILGQGGFFNQAVPGPGNDFVDGGTGEGGNEVIYLDAPNGVEGDLGAGLVTGHGTDELVNVQWLIGSEFDDVLVGFEGDDALFGAGGNDSLDALGGDFSFMSGGLGDDVVTGGAGVDFLGTFFFDANYLDAPPAGPITVDLVAQTLTGLGTDTLVDIDGSQGSLGDDVMIGNAEDNEFTTLLDGEDTVDAGAGDDLADGGDGVDDLDGGAGTDMLGHLDSSAGMTIDLSTSTTSDGDTIAGFEDVIGTFFADTITGTAGPNLLLGADGDDHLLGLAGDDVIFGDWEDFALAGTDEADGGDGNDQCDAEVETACEADPPPPTMALRGMVASKGVLAYRVR